MLRLQQIKLPAVHSRSDIEKKILKCLKIDKKQLVNYKIKKQSIDARKKQDITFSYVIDAQVTNEAAILKKNIKNVSKAQDKEYKFNITGDILPTNRPVIVGAGPAGIFCAYMLSKNGYRPIVIERGKMVDKRSQDVLAFWENGVLDPESNVQFGEGGAGTFSDGKLNTLVKDPVGRNKKVLELFVEAGAPEEILYVNKPHIGTDILVNVVTNLRNEIIASGGEFRFETCMTGIDMTGGKVNSVELKAADGTYTLDTDMLVLAIGHSARDTFEMLDKTAVDMSAKSFAVGFRVEHPQEQINLNQYGEAFKELDLPVAPYKLTASTSSGRGVYSFCMCPGGHVVNASSEEGRLAVNGMSYYKRDSHNANSAIIISVTPDDYPDDSALAGMHFQRELEKKAYELGKGKVPQQLYGDYKENRISTSYGSFESCLKGASEFANMRSLFTPEMSDAFIEGMESFDRYIKGFNRADAILSGVESRTSSPVRISRDESFQSCVKGIFPCGEGAGYAGGIMSAAMDGLKVAEAIAAIYRPF